MKASIDNAPASECRRVDVECRIGSSGAIPVVGMSPEEIFEDESLYVAIEQMEEKHRLGEDNILTIRLKKNNGFEITRRIVLTTLFNLIRDNYDEDGLPL
jgi:hypothetical protein